MKPSPCLNPRKVFNRSLGYELVVPCGHCDACLCSKGKRLVDKVNNNFLRFHTRFFITLTYNDEHLPLARYDSDLDLLTHPTDSDYNGVVKSVNVFVDKYKDSHEYILNCVNKYGGLPVLSHRHMILFKKKLRFYLSKKFGKYEKIYLFNSGEYGPSGFRPHYHLLFGIDKEISTSIFREIVRKSWSDSYKDTQGLHYESYGFIDVQRCVDRGGANYCAQYLACNINLFNVLSKSVFRPFHSESNSGFNRSSDEIRRFWSELPVTKITTRVSNGTQYPAPITYSDYSFIFPKFVGYNRLSLDGRVSVFEAIRGLLSRFSSRSCAEIADKLYFALKYNYDTRIFTTGCKPVVRDFEFILYDLYINDSLLDEYGQKKNIARFLQTCRCIDRVCNTLSLSARTYFMRADEFYSKLKLNQLKRFYDSFASRLDDPLYPGKLDTLMSMYYNTDPDISSMSLYLKQFGCYENYDIRNYKLRLMDDQSQRSHVALSHKIVLDNTKTKKRNDYFDINGWRKRPYVPILSKKLRKFNAI